MAHYSPKQSMHMELSVLLLLAQGPCPKMARRISQKNSYPSLFFQRAVDFTDVDLDGMWRVWSDRLKSLIPIEAKIAVHKQTIAEQVKCWNETVDVSDFDYNSLFETGEQCQLLLYFKCLTAIGIFCKV